jgi:hypothetical protein
MVTPGPGWRRANATTNATTAVRASRRSVDEMIRVDDHGRLLLMHRFVPEPSPTDSRLHRRGRTAADRSRRRRRLQRRREAEVTAWPSRRGEWLVAVAPQRRAPKHARTRPRRVARRRWERQTERPDPGSRPAVQRRERDRDAGLGGDRRVRCVVGSARSSCRPSLSSPGITARYAHRRSATHPNVAGHGD